MQAQNELDFTPVVAPAPQDARLPDPCPQDAPGEAAEVRVKESIVPGEADAPFAVGSKVFLRGCAFGQPGRVLRQEREKIVIYWGDLDYIARHAPASLVLAGGDSTTPGYLQPWPRY